jgi:predicted permease
LRQFGNVTIARERFYEAGRWRWLDTLGREIRIALRLFRRHVFVFCVALGGLALAISLCTVLFTFFNALIFQPVGIADPASAVHVRRITRSGGGMSWPVDQLEQLRDVVQQTTLEQWSEAELDFSVAAVSSGSGKSVSIQLVSGTYFTTFGGTAVLGRVLSPDDEGLGLPVGVMNHEFWRRRLGADASIVGRDIYVAGRPVRIVGVAAKGFGGIMPEPPAFWIPMQRAHPETANTNPFSPRDGAVGITGRLKSGIAHSQAQAEITSVAARLDDVEGPSQTVGAEFVSLDKRDRFGAILSSIIIVAGLLILALAATNAASLLLALAITRRTEIRIRMAVGASRWQLIRQWLVESSLISAISGAIGFAVAYLLMSWIVTVVDLPSTVNFVPGLRALIFAALLTFFAALVLGLLPFRFSIFKSTALRRQISNPRFPGSRRLRSFIAIQGAVSVILLILAALCARALVHVAHFDYGFDVNRLASVSMSSIGDDGRPYGGDFGSYRDTALERARLLPNVEAVSLSDYDPLIERSGDIVWVNRTSADFFKTVGFHFIRGRGYSVDEVRSGTDVAVITSNLSKKLWGTEDPLGRTLEAVNDRMRNTVVIGVIDDAWTNRLIGSVDSGTVYQPFHSVGGTATLIVRARTNGASIVSQLRAAIQAIDPDRRP